jgi:AraC-like DNA-binding protein
MIKKQMQNAHREAGGREVAKRNYHMASMGNQLNKQDGQRMEDYRYELVERIEATVQEDKSIEPLKGLRLHRASSPTELTHGVSDPAFCVIAQGSKEVLLGDECYRYDPMNYLLATSALPIVSHVTKASPEKPYLSLSVKLDPTIVSSVMVASGYLGARSPGNVRAMAVSPLTADLLGAVVRLVRLLDNPAEAPFLTRLIIQEIVYRLLRGEQGARLCYIAVQGGHTHQIAAAIAMIRSKLDQPLRMDDIAKKLGMSVSSFYHHFKTVTAISPLQFQKQVRLQEARRLMLAENLDATSAAHRVGYNDASHFSRDYKNLFGLPPLRDVQRLRKASLRTSG